MKSSVLTRPNLKLILLGAILVVLLQQFMTDGKGPGPFAVHARGVPIGVTADSYLARLLEQASKHPSPDLYGQISYVYERRRDFRKALVYFRAAELLAESEQDN